MAKILVLAVLAMACSTGSGQTMKDLPPTKGNCLSYAECVDLHAREVREAKGKSGPEKTTWRNHDKRHTVCGDVSGSGDDWRARHFYSFSNGAAIVNDAADIKYYATKHEAVAWVSSVCQTASVSRGGGN